MNFKQFLNEGWKRDGPNQFSAWVSDIQGHEHDTGKQARCPKCREPVILSTLHKHLDNEGDITEWSGKHKCGAALKVYND